MGLICFSSPFDEKSVDFLEKIKTPCYKIASFENQHFPLLKKGIYNEGEIGQYLTFSITAFISILGAKNIFNRLNL